MGKRVLGNGVTAIYDDMVKNSGKKSLFEQTSGFCCVYGRYGTDSNNSG